MSDQNPVQSRVTLPPTFSNSFWSSDYRTGFNSVYSALQSGIIESQEILTTVKSRVETERLIAQQLLPLALKPEGFGSDEGASLRMAYEAILTSTVGESKYRHQLADELMRSVYLPFSKWSSSHQNRINQSQQTVEQVLQEWEKSKTSVNKHREIYSDKCRTLDEIEDELEFVRGKEALLSTQSLNTSREGGGGGGAPQGIGFLPPRPFEIDQKDATTPLTFSRSLRLGRHSSMNQEQGSDDGSLPPIDNGDEEGFIDRSGATGGSVVAALGRALTVRRNKNTSNNNGKPRDQAGSPTIAETEEPVEGWKVMEDKNVKAALDFSKTKFSSLLTKVAGPQTGEERYLKARREVELSEEQYKLSVETLESLRLQLEELLSTHLPYLQHCESDRLRAATSVLKSFHSSVSQLPKQIQSSQERVQQTLELIRTEKDLKLAIERKRTGPFQPRPISFISHYLEPYSTSFGIDLRKYDETNTEPGAQEGGRVPQVLIVLLKEIERRMETVNDIDERRKSWLYETPLPTQHALRSLLNSPQTIQQLTTSELQDLLEPFDLAILCSVVKLWCLELEVPVISSSLYEELRALLPGRITSVNEGNDQGGKHKIEPESLIKVLGKLPAVHLETLRLLLSKLYPLAELEATSDTSDSRETYLAKLSLSMSRPLLRPEHETALTLDDRFPAVVIEELLKGGPVLMAQIQEAANKEREERYRPRRQRTKPIDVRVSRSTLGLGARESLDPNTASAYLMQQQQSSGNRLTQDLPSLPPPAPGKESLAVETSNLAPPIPIVSGTTQPGGLEFAASPVEDTSAPPLQANTPGIKEEKINTHQDGDGDSAPSAAAKTEAPFVPPTSSSETPFTPPSGDSSAREGASNAEETDSTAHEDKPLTSSTSLKRRSVQTGSSVVSGDKSSGGGGGAGGPGGSSRLRGARAPRPISASNSAVFDKVKQFEGAN